MDQERVSDCIWISEKLYEAQTYKEEPLTKWNVWKWFFKKYLQFNKKGKDWDV